MNLKRCENGHFYDMDKFQRCPHCAALGGDSGETQPLRGNMDCDTEPLTVPIAQPAAPPVQPVENVSLREAVGQAMSAPQEIREAEDEKTISLYQNRIGVEPVTGWLVCIEGQAFGESFKLKSGRNFIGRSQSMDIILPGDNSVSREKHAIILYEPRKREFIAHAGESRELFYLNDEVVLNPVRLKQYDIVTIGNTKLMFFPCCGDNFCWEDYKKEEKK